MARFNVKPQTSQAQPLLKTQPTSTLRTGNNAPGFQRDTFSELFLLAVSNFVGQDTYYEKGAARDQRYAELITEAVKQDADWVARMLRWLRHNANMRTASIVGAVEAAHAMIKLKIPGSRIIIDSVLVRADEPGEMLAYQFHQHGRNVPKAIKRGIADAVSRLYNERNTLKYDGTSKDKGVFRFGDVLEVVHAAPADLYQIELFKYLVSRGKDRDGLVIPDSLTMLIANQALRLQARTTPELLLNTTRLRQAGMTWEAAKSLAGSLSGKLFWEAMITADMGYMALLRNLRNFDQAGISDQVAQQVIAKLTNPAEVANSRQLPLRFLSAYRNVVSDRWKFPLSQALELSLQSIPELPGATLILVDTSGSMGSPMSDKSELRCWDAAVSFGLALASRQRAAGHEADVYSFSNSTKRFPALAGETLLQGVKRWRDNGFLQNGGTNTEGAIRTTFVNGRHDRVVILTDEQADFHSYRDVAAAVPKHIPVISFNLAGYKAAHMASSPTRISIGGLTDSAFTLIPALDRGARQQWPF